MERVCERGLLANSGTSPQQVTCVVPAFTMSGVSVRQINANGRGVFDREVRRMLRQHRRVHTWDDVSELPETLTQGYRLFLTYTRERRRTMASTSAPRPNSKTK